MPTTNTLLAYSGKILHEPFLDAHIALRALRNNSKLSTRAKGLIGSGGSDIDTTVEYKVCRQRRMSGQACLFSGRVQGIRSLISYEGTSTAEFVVDFHGATDEYLAVCHEDGTVPEAACNVGLSARF